MVYFASRASGLLHANTPRWAPEMARPSRTYGVRHARVKKNEATALGSFQQPFLVEDCVLKAMVSGAVLITQCLC